MQRIQSLVALALLVLNFCVAAPAFAQITFKHHFTHIYEDYGDDIEMLPGGDFLVLGSGHDTTYQNFTASLLRLDSYGQIRWRRIYGDPAIHTCPSSELVPAPNQEFYLVAYKWIGKINADGDLLGSTSFWDHSYYGGYYYEADQLPGGNLAILRRYRDSIRLEEYNPQLQFVRGNSFYHSDFSEVYPSSLAISPSGEVLIAGLANPDIGFLMKLDSAWNLSWARRFDPGVLGFGRKVAFSQNGNVMLAFGEDTGYSVLNLMAFSPGGDPLWRKQYDSGANMYSAVLARKWDGWLMTQTAWGVDAHASMVSVDHGGNLLWARDYGQVPRFTTQGKPVPGGGHVILGSGGAPNHPFADYDFLLMKTDNVGRIKCDDYDLPLSISDGDTAVCQSTTFGSSPFQPMSIPSNFGELVSGLERIVECQIVSSDQPSSESGMEVWPQPANEKVNVRIDGEVIHLLSLLNTQGQLVLHTTVDAAQFELDLKGLPAGMYFLEAVTASGNVLTDRLVVW